MSCYFIHRFFEIIVHFINALCLLILCLAGNLAFVKGSFSDIGSVICIIGYGLCNNIKCALKRFLYILDFLLLVYILLCFFNKWSDCLLCQNDLGKSIQPLLLGYACSCLTLRSVRTIQVFYDYHSLCCLNLVSKFFCQHSLLFNTAQYLLFLIFQITQISQSLIKISQYFIIERACCFLTVSGNKRNRIALVY